MDHLQKAVSKHNTDIILAQEPLVRDGKIAGIPLHWSTWMSKNSKAAIILPNSSLHSTVLSTTDNAIAVTITLQGKPCSLISAYSSPLADIEPALSDIQSIISSVAGENFLAGTDLNGHHTSWGYSDNDNRGRAIEDFVNSQSLVILNEPDAPSVLHSNGTVGWPNLTIASSSEISQLTSCEVLQEETMSHHQYIRIQINSARNTIAFRRFKTKYGGHRPFIEKIKQLAHNSIVQIKTQDNIIDLDNTIEKIHNEIIEACKKSYKIKKTGNCQTPSLVDPRNQIS
ncbi:hypothetical protein AVEN_227323-1 [Araneus ventricosus]|uniref:Endonuclease/exonuclease/phosphatase domain-containing protein n=1 Tax=Araneus ventricosus TaxID=182803 RepID=A0A4Y2GVB6_ARAVE|nr:hypothetical protein AVEN_227323-1 [Araneus ventricosus]